MGRLILVLGGARSGKSDFAQRLAKELGGDKVVFVATAEARDEEMQRRIEVHRQTRPPGWKTAEAPRRVGEAVQALGAGARVVLVDCVTLLVSNTVLALGESPEAVAAEAAVTGEVRALLDACRESTATFIVVSNEVGLGLVPDNPLGRLYRDLLGQVNQTLAAQASAVYLLVAGLPLEIKSMTRYGRTTPR